MKKLDPAEMKRRELKISNLMKQIMGEIPGVDIEDPQMVDTPKRVARMFLDMFWGLDERNLPRLTTFSTGKDVYGMVGTGKIFFSSFCAHHLLSFSGYAYCFYIPDKLILGISKFTRLVEYYAARPQLQERLAVQIADHIVEVTECHGCFVVLRAVHGCMQCRGVKQVGSVMVTPVIRPVNAHGVPEGPFANIEVRGEALALMEMDK